ncbi:MAG TPA: ATP-binding protein [Pantanalinema sp.]
MKSLSDPLLYDILSPSERHSLLAPGEAVLVGCSGGADSLALVHALCALAPERGWHVEAAYVHHGLRPEADREAELLAARMASWGVPFRVARVAIRLAPGQSPEEAVRDARYAALNALARASGATRLAPRALNPAIHPTLSLNLAVLADEDDYLSRQAQEAIRPLLCHEGPGLIGLEAAGLALLPPALPRPSGGIGSLRRRSPAARSGLASRPPRHRSLRPLGPAESATARSIPRQAALGASCHGAFARARRRRRGAS